MYFSKQVKLKVYQVLLGVGKQNKCELLLPFGIGVKTLG